MSEFAKGMSDGVKQGEGVMEQVNKVGDNLTGAITDIGADVAAQGEKAQAAKARWGAATGNIIALAKGKITDMGTAAQASMAQAKMNKAGKSAADLFSEVVPDPVGLVASIPGKMADGTNALVKGYDDQKQKYSAGVQQGIQDYKNSTSNEGGEHDGQYGGRRRRRRRRTRRKKRRKSRKSRRKRRKSRKKFKKHYMWNKKGKRYRVKTYKQHIKGVRLGHTHKKPKKSRRRRRR